MRILILTLLFLTCLSCKGQENNFVIFKNELGKISSNSKNIKTTNKNVTVTKPIVSNILMQKIIDKTVLKEIDNDFCDNKECEVNIKFELGHNTNKLLSLKESMNSMFRTPRDLNSINFHNFIIIGNELYEIKIKITADIKHRITNKLRQSKKDSECEYLKDNNTLIDLYIAKGISYVHLYNDEICNQQIKFDFKSSDLVFVKITTMNNGQLYNLGSKTTGQGSMIRL